MIKDLAFVAYSVRDLAAAKAFYRDVVGLEPGESMSDYWAEFTVGSAAFGLGDGTSLGMEPGKSTGAAFEVDDVAAMREKLLQRGVKVSDLSNFPGCSACFVTDPEGNTFALHQLHT